MNIHKSGFLPELPEVETVRIGLSERLKSFQINRIVVCRSRVIASPGGVEAFITGLSGSIVGKWNRRGKYLLASLQEKRGTWGIHLRMTGQFQFFKKSFAPCPHTRARFWNSKGSELRFVDMRSFGEMWWVPPDEPIESIITGLKRLGPEPFCEDFSATYLQSRLKGSKRAIKSALLDQSLVAGVGNIYADESLFKAGIAPKTPSNNLSYEQLKHLKSSIVKVLKTSIREGGTTFKDFRDLEGINGNYGSQAWVYRRGGEKCRHCGTTIIREKLSGRSTHWCPNCQKSN